MRLDRDWICGCVDRTLSWAEAVLAAGKDA